MSSLQDIDVVVLAGGLGTRLAPAWAGPKVLAPVAGRPFLHYVLDQLANAGGKRIILSLGHRASEVAVSTLVWRDALAVNQGVELVFVRESNPEGPANAVLRAGLCSNRAALVVNGDTYVAADPVQFADLARQVRIDGGPLPIIVPWAGVAMPDPGDGPHVGWVYARPAASAWAFWHYWCDHLPTSIPKIPGEYPFVDIGTPEGWRGAEEFLRRHGVIS